MDFLKSGDFHAIKDNAHEEHIALRIVILLRIENVAAMPEQISRDAGNNARLIGAGERQDILSAGHRGSRH